MCLVKQKTAYELRIGDGSSDVCSSDLPFAGVGAVNAAPAPMRSRLFPVASHVGQDRLGGGMPACFGHAAVGLFRHPGDDQNFLGARHRDIEQQIGRAPSELQSLMRISYAVFCLKKKNKDNTTLNEQRQCRAQHNQEQEIET